jgi:arylsulfatase A-like enzyme
MKTKPINLPISINIWSKFKWLAPVLGCHLLIFTISAHAAPPPNIIIILGDDIGYGDLGCYDATEVKTPNVDHLAKEGLRFVNGYATAATCTPSRFSLLTGEYAFRQPAAQILPGDAPLLIRPGSDTLPAMLQRAGYATAVIGKWHLGLGEKGTAVNWNGDIKPGPLEVGFDYSFLIPATPDRVPCVYVQNHRVLNLDPADPIQVSYQKPFPGEVTYKNDTDPLDMESSDGHDFAVINGIGRIGYMIGGKSALWQDNTMEKVLAGQAVTYIEKEHAQGKPFFLYYASHDIHVPRVPNQQFVGKTSMGPRGDEIVEFDHAVGRILDTLKRLKLTDNTLVILSSDNGPVLDDGYKDQANEKIGDHQCAGPFRSGKYSLFEGGTRMPFITCWPGRIKPGVSAALVSQVDLLASLAALTGETFKTNDAPDSENLLTTLMGQSPVGRKSLIEQSAGDHLALREGNWKYIPPGRVRDGLGPWTIVKIPEPGFLFDLSKDPGETNNLAAAYPEKLQELRSQFQSLTAGGEAESKGGKE